MTVLFAPVLREATQIYFVEGKGWLAYLYFLAVLATSQTLTLFLPSLDPGNWLSAAQVFKVSCIVTLVAGCYFTLRLVNQEYVAWKFLPLNRWLQRESLSSRDLGLAQLTLLGLYTTLFILVALPPLTWAAAIARAGLGLLFGAVVLVWAYFVTYGVWGLVALNLWEARVETRHIFVRFLFGCFFIITALVHLPLNPIAFLLSYLSGTDLGGPVVVFGLRRSTALHILFHFFILAGGIALCQWLLTRKGKP